MKKKSLRKEQDSAHMVNNQVMVLVKYFVQTFVHESYHSRSYIYPHLLQYRPFPLFKQNDNNLAKIVKTSSPSTRSVVKSKLLHVSLFS